MTDQIINSSPSMEDIPLEEVNVDEDVPLEFDEAVPVSQGQARNREISHSAIIQSHLDGTEIVESFAEFEGAVELGGDKQDVSAFRAYSMICLHLWCLWKYWPEEGRKRGECPCHGSMYDPTTGTAFAGPASLQAPPSNTLPNLDFEADVDGFMYVLPPTWGVNKNGVVGYGRFV